MRGSAASGANTRELVLKSARELLVRNGYADFSIRRVADAAGITVGNLTYHFPSKRELVRALIESLIADYLGAKQRLYSDASAQPERRLERLIDWLIRDAASASTQRLFRELWTMALHDPAVTRIVDDFYDYGIDAIATTLRDEQPELTASEALELAHVIALVIEGTSVIFGTRAERKVPLERLTQVISQMIARALEARPRAAAMPATRRASRA
jgi:AcrR family transcriptional regulator